MLGRADEGLCPAILKRQLHYGMEIGIIHHMTELNTSRLFSEQNDSWGREQLGTRSLRESAANDEPSNGTFQQLGTQTAWHTPSSRGVANNELSNVSLGAAKSDKGVSTS